MEIGIYLIYYWSCIEEVFEEFPHSRNRYFIYSYNIHLRHINKHFSDFPIMQMYRSIRRHFAKIYGDLNSCKIHLNV